jgi:hypothetical protein
LDLGEDDVDGFNINNINNNNNNNNNDFVDDDGNVFDFDDLA